MGGRFPMIGGASVGGGEGGGIGSLEAVTSGVVGGGASLVSEPLRATKKTIGMTTIPAATTPMSAFTIVFVASPPCDRIGGGGL